jgi:hypothetical protein
MGWRTIGSKRYYQQTYCDVDGRVRSRYIGRGPRAEAVASLDARRRERRIERKEHSQAERDRFVAIEMAVVEYCSGVDELFAASMRLNGWHLHHGQWRRNGRITRRVIMTKGYKSLDAAARAEEFARCLAKGDFDGLMLRFGGNMAFNSSYAIICRIGSDPIQRASLVLKVGRLQHDLAGKDPSPIEKVLAERVAVCYLDAYYSDQLAQWNCDMIRGEFYERRQDRAHRRYLQAIKTLAECRKLEAQTIQQTVEGLRLVG